MVERYINFFFHFDALAGIMIGLVSFIGVCVGSFAYRYMHGDRKYRSFFLHFILMLLSVLVMVSSDHILLFFIALCMSNFFLVRLMVHKSSWKAAKASGSLASKNYMLGAFCIAIAFFMFYWITGETSIKLLLETHTESTLFWFALFFLLIGAMTQSAIWPFHRWLISSLNSPTPVSSIMHAGLVNGGGFILARFAPLYLEHVSLLVIIFMLGMISVLMGTLWKLMQSDVKRMLACSTMAQMGFMFVQCGLGLFSIAVAHLIFHGMFKAYLFLASGSAAQEKRFDLTLPSPKPSVFMAALICGILGSFCFGLVTGKSWFSGDSTLLIMVIVLLAAMQFSLSLLQGEIKEKFPFALMMTAAMGGLYGVTVYFMSASIDLTRISVPQPLNFFYVFGIVFLVLSWFCFLFMRGHKSKDQLPVWKLKGYVVALNASQPHPTTITTHRNQYKY